MRIDEAVGFMSKAYLHRVIDSFTKDLHKPGVGESRVLIARNARELADEKHIRTKLRRGAASDSQVLMKMLPEAWTARTDIRTEKTTT